LTQEQRGKLRAIDPGLAVKCTAQRNQREALQLEELKAMRDILTPSSVSGSSTTRTYRSLEREPHGARRAKEQSSRVVDEIRLRSEFVGQENVVHTAANGLAVPLVQTAGRFRFTDGH
jgi:hypothetical protein